MLYQNSPWNVILFYFWDFLGPEHQSELDETLGALLVKLNAIQLGFCQLKIEI